MLGSVYILSEAVTKRLCKNKNRTLLSSAQTRRDADKSKGSEIYTDILEGNIEPCMETCFSLFVVFIQGRIATYLPKKIKSYAKISCQRLISIVHCSVIYMVIRYGCFSNTSPFTNGLFVLMTFLSFRLKFSRTLGMPIIRRIAGKYLRIMESYIQRSRIILWQVDIYHTIEFQIHLM